MSAFSAIAAARFFRRAKFSSNTCQNDEPKFATSHAKWNDAYRKKWGITNGPAAEFPELVQKDLRKLARNVYAWLEFGDLAASISVSRPATKFL